MNHSKHFIGKPQRKLESKKQNCSQTFSQHFTHSHTAQHICSGSGVNFWSASALWEVRSVNFTPVAVCTKSLVRKNCFISSGVQAESPHSKSKHLGRWTVPGSMLMSGTFGGERWNHTAWKSSRDKFGVKNVWKLIDCFCDFCLIGLYRHIIFNQHK